MAYVLDSSVFIEAWRRYYSPEICPAFWDFLATMHNRNMIASVEQVRTELSKGRDELAKWAGALKDGFFVKPSGPVFAAMTRVADWVNANHEPKDAQSFLAGADPAVIAHGLAHNKIVVSNESSRRTAKNKVKIPAVCSALNVTHADPYTMLKEMKARFVLERK